MSRRRKIYTTRREKVVDFMIGFVGWFILNGLMTLLTTIAPVGLAELSRILQSSDPNQLVESAAGVVSLILLCLPLLINLALLIYFAFTRAWIAIGGASAFAAVILLTICAGIVFTVACFVMLNGSGITN
jgi:hypothetical protein